MTTGGRLPIALSVELEEIVPEAFNAGSVDGFEKLSNINLSVFSLDGLKSKMVVGPGGWIRTSDLLLPRQAGTARLPHTQSRGGFWVA